MSLLREHWLEILLAFVFAIAAPVVLAWLGWPWPRNRISKAWRTLTADRRAKLALADRLTAVLIAAIFSICWNLKKDWLLYNGLTFAVLVLAIAAWSLFPFFWLLFPRNRRKPRICVLLSQYHNKQFFADVWHHLSNALSAAGLTFDIFKPEQEEYSAADQDGHLANVLKNRQIYAGALIVPVEPHERAPQLKRFLSEFQKPVVFFDAAPFDDEKDYGHKSCFVGCDNQAGGRDAAKALIQLLREQRVATPRVLVICGKMQAGRQQAFEAKIREVFPNANIILNDEGRFSRDDAYDLARNYFREANKRQESYDGVFCTNDEMALGVIDAFFSLPQEPNRQTTVIGYDGIQEAIKMIGREATPLKNTVVQDTRELAKQPVNLLARMIEGDYEGLKRVTLLQTRLYRHFDERLISKSRHGAAG